tara:strand:- start:220 stop:495 length:276 start_codon:yes stop_codon:yes gene_type:complete
MIKHLTIILAFLTAIGSQSISAEHKFSNEDCDGLYEGIVSLLGEADNNWEHLEQNPVGSPDYVEHTMKIQWTVDVAANYTTIYEAFCVKTE